MIGRRDCALLALALPARSGGVNSARCRSPTWPKTSEGSGLFVGERAAPFLPRRDWC